MFNSVADLFERGDIFFSELSLLTFVIREGDDLLRRQRNRGPRAVSNQRIEPDASRRFFANRYGPGPARMCSDLDAGCRSELYGVKDLSLALDSSADAT